MSKWRPRSLHNGCLYVIPDIHGAHNLLQLILKRITPLRKKDKIVFLGDYIDCHFDSHKVLDTLIELQREYGDQIQSLMGNHELMLLYGLGYLDPGSAVLSRDNFRKNQQTMWLKNGGRETMWGYAQRAGKDSDPTFNLGGFLVSTSKIKSIIPTEHIDFLLQLKPYYEQDNFVFVHGGCHPDEPPSKFTMDTLCWDRSLLRLVLSLIEEDEPLDWKKTIITGHNTRRKPVVADNFLMLDIGAPQKLLVTEVYTRESFLAQSNKQRLVKYELKPTMPKKLHRTPKTGPLVKRLK